MTVTAGAMVEVTVGAALLAALLAAKTLWVTASSATTPKGKTATAVTGKEFNGAMMIVLRM